MTAAQQTAIGKIPRDWKVVKAKEVFSLEYGKGLPEKRRVAGKYPVVGSNGIVGYHNQALVSGPGIVVGRKGTIGAISWIESDFWPIDTTYYVKLKKDNVSLKWLFFKLSHLNLERFNLSDVVPGLKRDLVYNMKFSLPPLPEQRRIVEVLSGVDDAIRGVIEAIATTERLKKGLMQKLLTEGIGHREYKETKIGKIPKTWKVVNLGNKNVATLIMGQSPPSSTYNKEEIGLPFLQGKAEFGEIYPSPDVYCSKPIKVAQRNDVLLSVRAPVGDVNIAPFRCCIGRGLSSIRSKSGRLYYRFLFYYLKFANRRFEALSMGSTFKAIRKREIENYKIPLPPLVEQQKIAEILSTIDSKVELDRKRKLKLERIKRGLMNDLLPGRRRVKVAM